jgi:hypothetical protein
MSAFIERKPTSKINITTVLTNKLEYTREVYIYKIDEIIL